MTSPTGTPHSAPPGRARLWTRRLTASLTATTAGGVLLLGSPVLVASSRAPGTPTGADTGEASVRLVAAERHRWPGHPNRALVRHRVRPGETATGLAVRYHAWTRELRRVNHLGRRGTLYVGRVIRIPVVLSAVRREHRAKRARHHARAHHARHHARHRAHHHRPWRGAHASRATVRRVIVRTALRHHVRPRIVLAIAWQESGWQQRRRSSTGAIGAMQVMPGTGRWMSVYLGRRINIYSLRDNVLAGVVLYKVLRAQTSRKRAIGGYYQGLGSIQKHGMYPSTKAYVRSVRALDRALRRGWNPA